MENKNNMENKIRLRFAPSPTGFLHIGNLRTAFFGYLLAKSQGGKFILRIEDTDEKREVEGAVKSLLSILDWIGIKLDEGPGSLGGDYGPYIQSERISIYKKHIDTLLAEDKAYPCFCSEERLTKMREDQILKKKAPGYDKLCRSLSKEDVAAKIAAGESYVIRQKMPLSGEVRVHDELRGDIVFKAEELDDHVLIKSNGVPTYQFASVVDDHLMEISHVTRGDEWLGSFPKNILLYQAFGWQSPLFIHFPLLLNKTGGKLSKRQGDVFVEEYKNKGYLKEAIINFCALLGWHPKDDKEILSLEELEKNFNISGLGSSPAVFDIEKLDYFNAYYLRQKDNKDLVKMLEPYLNEAGFNTEDARLENFVSLVKDRLKKLSDVVEAISFFFKLPNYEVELLAWKNMDSTEAKKNLQEVLIKLESFSEADWQKEKIEAEMLTWIKEEKEGKNGNYLWPMRVALSGLKNSPSPFEIAWALGREESLIRIKKAL